MIEKKKNYNKNHSSNHVYMYFLTEVVSIKLHIEKI